MFPDELIQILQKYKEEMWLSHIENLNKNFKQTISLLKGLRNHLADKLYDIYTSDSLDNSADCEILSSEISLLKQQILNYIKLQEATKVEYNFTNETSEELTSPIFEKKVYPYLVSDDICPFCNCKMSLHLVHYQRIVDSNIKNEDVMWNRCPACKRLFVLDYDAEEFDFNNTNIILDRKYYDIIPPIDINSVIVLGNTLKCSFNHNINDITAKIPVLNESGEIYYVEIRASYCSVCDRFTILKDEFDKISDIVTCKVIDETSSSNPENQTQANEAENDGSILKYYGYNVQTQKNISEQQRHIILSSVIEAEIMSRRQVVDLLEINIKRKSTRPDCQLAIQKWREDINFVNTYKTEELPKVVFDKIILRYKK